MISAERPGFVSNAVVVELEWVLRSGYGLDDGAIRGALLSLMDTSSLAFEAEPAVRRAAESSKGDFSDRLIHFVGMAAGCDRTVTFDRKFARLPGVELLKAAGPS